MTKFREEDPARAQMWVQSSLLALPVRIVDAAEWDRLTEHLKCFDDDPSGSSYSSTATK
jgi:hypothetical protein